MDFRSATGLLQSGAGKVLSVVAVLGIAAWDLSKTEERDVAVVKDKCDRYGVYRGQSAITVESLFEQVSEDTTSFMDAEEYLLNRRFRFVEYRRPLSRAKRSPRYSPYVSRFLEDDLPGSDVKPYVRIFVAPATDSRCEPFKKYIRRGSILEGWRWDGLGADQCLAVELADEPSAEIEHVAVRERAWPGTRGGRWSGWIMYRDRATGKPLARLWTGGFHSKDARSLCRNEEEIMKMDASVVGPGIPDLPPPPRVTELRGQNFPVRRVAAVESIENERAPEKRKSSPRSPKRDFNNWEAPGRVIDNGFTYLAPQYGRYGGGVGLVGYRLFVVRKGLRRVTYLEDAGLPFPSCHDLQRQGEHLLVTCEAQRESYASAKWVRGSWLLIYTDDGRPAEKITLSFDASPLSGVTSTIARQFQLLENDRVRSHVQYSRRIEGRYKDFEADITFRLLTEDGAIRVPNG